MADNRCRAQWDGPTPYAVLCELPAGHAENHRGRGPHMIAQWPQAPKPEPVLTRSEAEQRLTVEAISDALDKATRAIAWESETSPAQLRSLLLAALFHEEGSTDGR